MGVHGPGGSVDVIVGLPISSHPLAIPAIPGPFGVWQVRRVKDAPIGYVRSENASGGAVYHCYARGRDDAGGRPWLRTTKSLNSAVAWMIQHERDLAALTRRLHPEPDEWPA